MDDGVSKVLKMRNRCWVIPFWEKQTGGGWGGCMARKCVEGLLGDEVRDLDMDGSVFVYRYGWYWNDYAVFIIVVEGGGSGGKIVLVAVRRSGCRRVRKLRWVEWSI